MNSQIHKPMSSLTHKLASSTYTLITNSHSSTQKLNNSQTHQPANSPTQKLKLLLFILQCCSNFRAILAKIQAKK